MSAVTEPPKGGRRRFWSPGNVARLKGRAVKVVRLEVRVLVRDVETGKLRSCREKDLYEKEPKR